MAGLKEQVDQLQREVQELKRESVVEQDIGIEQRLATLETRLIERYRVGTSLLNGERITGTTHASAGTASTHSHTLNRKPTMVFITSEGNGVVYKTAKSNSDITVKGSANSLAFVAYLLI